MVANAPAPNSFRPPYVQTAEVIPFTYGDIDGSKLLRLAPTPSAPTLESVTTIFKRPWLDHIGSWVGRFHHPTEHMPAYGREFASDVGKGALALHLDYPFSEKERLLIYYLQLGIDLYGIAVNGGKDNWQPDGGHASGCKWPILFAGLIFNNDAMRNIGQNNEIYFGEDSQTFYVSQTDIDMTHSPDPRAEAIEYEQSDLGLAEWGIRHATRPILDNKNWKATYRECCTANAWSGFILAAQLMDARQLWNHEPLFDYQNRYMQVEPPGWERSNCPFSAEMWDLYWNNEP